MYVCMGGREVLQDIRFFMFGPGVISSGPDFYSYSNPNKVLQGLFVLSTGK